MEKIERLEGVVIVEPIINEDGQKKVLPGAKKTLACTLDKFGNIKHGFTPEEISYIEKTTGATCDDKYWADFRVVLSDVTRTFNLSDIRSWMNVKFVRQHPMVVDIGEPMTQSSKYRIIDEEFEASKKAEQLDYKKTAYKYLEEMDLEDAKGFLRLYGMKADKLTRNVVLKRLDEKLVDSPKKFVSLYEDKNKDIKILLKELVSLSVIRMNKSHFYWGEIHLGENLENAITYIKDKDNQSDLIAMRKELEEKRKIV